jgi:hypothetical protein
MNHEPLPKQKIRIIEVDRKLAAQLADVWGDMKLQIEKSVESFKKPRKPSKLQNEVKHAED